MENSLLGSWRSQPERTRGYVVAVVSVLIATSLVILLRGYLAQSIYILYIAPIALAAWYGGRGPSLLATLLGLISANTVFVDRVHVVVPQHEGDLVGMGLFVLVGLVIVHLSDLLRTARNDLIGHAEQLEEQSMELELQTAELEQQNQEAQTLSEELEEANETLKASMSEQLNEAQSLARVGSWEWDVESGSIRWSDQMYRLYGMEPGSVEISYELYQSLIHPEDRQTSGEVVRHSLSTGDSFSYDHRIVRADGVARIFHARGKVEPGPDGKARRMFGTGHDVTDVRNGELAIKSATEQAAKHAMAEAAAHHLTRILSQAPVMIAVLTGPEHRFEMLNEKAREIMVVEDIIGLSVAEALPGVTQQGFGHLLDSVYSTGQPFVGREMFVKLGNSDDGRGGYFNFVFQPLSDDNGVYSVLVVATDVTDLVTSRLNAESSQAEAVAASRAKSDFLARMSHELRTPLAAIIGYGELLADGITGPVNDEQKKQLNRIRASANHLLAIIDEILTLARMEAGKEKVEIQRVEVGELLETVATMAEPLAAAKGLTFRFDEHGGDKVIRTDPMKLRQVLLNLISNAVKYTVNGGVLLRTESMDGEVHFLVTDTGIGIADEHLEKIFEPFWQVEQTTTRRAGGTGLGLAVTRQFVDLLGGRMSVTSHLGEGSTFQITVPTDGPAPEHVRL